MNILFFEFDPEYTDAILGIFNVRKYDQAFAFVKEENINKLEKIVNLITSKTSIIVINDTESSALVIAKTILDTLQKIKDYSAFFTICRTQKVLEKTALNLSATAKIKACFVCLEDQTSSIFDLSDAQFIRMCFDTDNYSDTNDTHVSTNKKFITRLVGKFAFLEKVLKKNHD